MWKDVAWSGPTQFEELDVTCTVSQPRPSLRLRAGENKLREGVYNQ